MGASESTPRPPPPSNPETLNDPWRPEKWSERETMVRTLREFQSSQNVEHLRILLVGPAGSGKSSFITSVNNVFQDRSTYLAHSLTPDPSFTNYKYSVYKLKKDTVGSLFPFVFGDTIGFTEGSAGVRTNDIINILKGHIQEGYTFNPQEDLNAESNDYNANPGLNDKVHCLVFVLPADSMGQLSQGVRDKMKIIQNEAHDLDIPVVAIMTKVDVACPLVKENLTMIYKSKKIKMIMEQCSSNLSIPLKYIFPIKNYHEEIETNMEIDVLILTALTNIVNFASDFVNRNQ